MPDNKEQKPDEHSEWYIVLHPFRIGSHSVMPGAIIQRVGVQWRLEEWRLEEWRNEEGLLREGGDLVSSIPEEVVCRVPRSGIPVYQLRRISPDSLEARRVGGDSVWERIPMDKVLHPPMEGQAYPYVLFGNHFFKIEMFRT
jgi:hypothetical protein